MRYIVEAVVHTETEEPIVRTDLPFPMPDETQLGTGKPLKHLVRPYRIESRNTLEQRNRDLHEAVMVRRRARRHDPARSGLGLATRAGHVVLVSLLDFIAPLVGVHMPLILFMVGIAITWVTRVRF